MKKIKLLLLPLLTLPLIASADPSTEIQGVYDELDEAILAQEGDKAYGLLSKESQGTLEEIQTLALTADKETLLTKPIAVILSVFNVRSEAKDNPPQNGPETLLAMSSDYEQTSKMTKLGDITVDGDTATAAILINGNPAPMGLKYAFIKEDGSWKVDMAKQLDEIDNSMSQMFEGAGMDRNFMLEQMAASQGGGVDVWKPME